jgi:T5SS/PEP-CTERM-associated repeat protein
MKTKCTPQTAQKLTNKVILVILAALALYASPSSRGDAAQCNQLPTAWTYSGSGSWFNSSNWCDGVPLCPFPACISNGGTAQINSTDQAAYACETFLGHFECFGPFCQGSGQSAGSLFVDGGTLNTCNWMHVGYQGTGNLKITNGGLVSSIGADIATGASSYGAATVDGSNSQWTVTGDPGVLYVGGTNGNAGGTGLLTVTNGGKASAGSVYVYKSGTLAGKGSVSGTTTIEGTLAPDWTLTITGDIIFLSIGNTPTMQCSVIPSNLGSIDAGVSGAATLDGKVSVTMTGTFTPGTQFTLLHAAGGLGNTRFLTQSINFPTGQNFTPKINYDANHVYLYLQPNTGP